MTETAQAARRVTGSADLRRILFGVAAGTSALACLMSALAGSAFGAVFAASTAGLILAALVVDHLRSFPSNHALLSRAAEYAEAGQRLAIYERETGLLAHWYLKLRGKEECDRAARYGRPLTLLLVEPTPESDALTVQGQLAEWLRQYLRSVDVTGYLGNGRYVVLMPETDAASARQPVERLQHDIVGSEAGASVFGADGATFDELYEAALQRLGKPIEQVA